MLIKLVNKESKIKLLTMRCGFTLIQKALYRFLINKPRIKQVLLKIEWHFLYPILPLSKRLIT